MNLLGRQRQKFRRWIKGLTDARRPQFANFIKSLNIEMTPPFIVGEKVMDDLTRELHTVTGIQYQNGRCENKKENCHHCWGIWVDSDYLGGGRHPWELTKTEDIRG